MSLYSIAIKRICKMFICIGIPKHWRLSLVQVRNVYWLLVFRHEERERHNFYYADCSYIVLQSTPSWTALAQCPISTHWPNKHAAHSVDLSWTGLARVRISTNCFFFQITKNPSPSLPGMTSFSPQSYFLSGVFIMIFVIVTSSAWTVLNVFHLHMH